MATAAEIQVAYKAIYRTDLNATVAAAIANSGISVDAYVAQQLPQVASTTQAAVAIASFVTGTTPTSAKLDALKIEADKQVASYAALGQNATLGAYEAFGRSFATDATTTAGFNTKYGALSTADFIAVVYAQVYGTQPTAGAAANLTAQINYFTNLYTTNGVANAALAAKGAVLGQIVGYAFTTSASANSNLDNQVQSVLVAAAKGDTTVYNKALPVVVDPGQAGVTINFAAGNTVNTTQADPALKTTAFNDTIIGTYTAATIIDGGAGEDTAQLTVGAGGVTVAAGGLSNVETIQITSGAVTTDIGAATGYKTVGFKNATADAATISNIAAGTVLTLEDTDTPNSVVFTIKDAATNAADVANLTVTTFNDIAKTVTLTGVETVNLAVTTGNSALKLADASLKTLNVSATKNVALDLTAATVLDSVTATGAGSVGLGTISSTVKSVDGSGLTGATGLTVVTSAGALATNGQTTSVKGGAGVDTITINQSTGVSVDAGAGNDTITVDLVTAANTATVKGGLGADTINLTSGKVTVVYTSAAESTTTQTDSLVDFTTGSDKVDLKALNLATDKTAINTFAALTGIVDGADYFGGKAVAYGTFTGVAGNFLLADVNGDGKFNVGSDLIVKVAGTTPVLADIVFV